MVARRKKKEPVEQVESTSKKWLVEVTVPMPDTKFQVSAENLLDAAKKIKIETSAQYEDAANVLKRLSVAEAQIDEQRTTLKAPINKAAAAIQALFKPSLTFLDEAKEIIKKEMGTYYQREEQRRLEGRRRADAAAEAERQRLIDQATSTRRVSAKTELLAQARNVVAEYTPVEAAPAVSGITMREYWEWEIEDETLIPRQFLIVDETMVNAIVKAKKSNTKIPGIKVKPTNKPAVGSR